MESLSAEQLESCRKSIVSGIRSFVSSAGARGTVVAVSGGVDSAVVLKLASEAVDTYALLLPQLCVNDPADLKDAKELARSLGVKYSVVAIDDIVEAFEEAFPWVSFEEKNRHMAAANIKPRVRMVLNYLLANLDSRVVLGTGNRTELLLGYFTKYGDGGCDLLPIGGLYKTRVWELARHLKLPEPVVDKVPSAGLWKDQTDEGELGAPYGVIDDVLHAVVGLGLTSKKAAEKFEVDLELVEHLMARMSRNRHKRELPHIIELGL